MRVSGALNLDPGLIGWDRHNPSNSLQGVPIIDRSIRLLGCASVLVSLIPIVSLAAAFRLSREPPRVEHRIHDARRWPVFWAFALLRISVAAIAFLLPAVNFFFTIFSS